MGTLTVSVQDAAKLMGVAERRIRGLINRGEVDFGVAYPSAHLNQWTCLPERTTYVIFAPKLAKHLGLTLDELREEVKKLHE